MQILILPLCFPQRIWYVPKLKRETLFDHYFKSDGKIIHHFFLLIQQQELVSFYNAYPILYPKRLQKMHKNFTLLLPFQQLPMDPESEVIFIHTKIFE